MIRQCIETMSEIMQEVSTLEQNLIYKDYKFIIEKCICINFKITNLNREVIYLMYHEKYSKTIRMTTSSFCAIMLFKLNTITSLTNCHLNNHILDFVN